jgi:hypothetical protein
MGQTFILSGKLVLLQHGLLMGNGLHLTIYHDQQYKVFTVNVDSGNIRQITHQGSYAYPEWTPEGDIVALVKSERPSKVVIMSENGNNLHPCNIFQPGDEEMVWSPDGSIISFNRCGYLCFMNKDGTGLKEVPYGGPGKAGVFSIAWLPDGSGVAFSARWKENAGRSAIGKTHLRRFAGWRHAFWIWSAG